MQTDLIKDYGFEEKGWFNNRCFLNKGSLLIVKHNGDFYWDTSNEYICYDYPIESTEKLEKLIKLYEKFDFCKQNSKAVTLFDYRQCIEEIKTLRRIWNK